jgi:hypothetical protein
MFVEVSCVQYCTQDTSTNITLLYKILLQTLRYCTRYFYKHYVIVQDTSINITLLYKILLQTLRYCTRYSYKHYVIVQVCRSILYNNVMFVEVSCVQ